MMPYFRNVCERDSYLKHLYNYNEQKEDDQYWMIRDLRKRVLSELVMKHGPVITRRGTILEKDGWETVVKGQL